MIVPLLMKKGNKMSDAIIVALITGAFSIVGVIVSNLYSNAKMQKNMEINQAVTDTKLDELTREVRSHNDFAMKIPVIQNEISNIKDRLDDVEKKV